MSNTYPSHLSDREWEAIKIYFEVDYSKGGRPFKHTKRELLEAIFYVLRTGCQWHYLPKDFPHWKTVYTYFKRWKGAHLFEKINHHLRKKLRVIMGRNLDPSAAIVDSQSVKTVKRGGAHRLRWS
ncbi:Insertion element IS402 uncharacterized 16.2 kDa protein [Neochlamydia sp. TUME1]|nr:Insertion element IS402 uncharacterized 16.2 kDa protein [Neochlamydia sp. TUME1]